MSQSANLTNTVRPIAKRFWVFVCNPTYWHIRDFLNDGKTETSWHVHNNARNASVGDLVLIRVTDPNNLNKADKTKIAPPKPSIYGVCEILEAGLKGFGSDLEYSSSNRPSREGPMVRLRFNQTLVERPLSAEFLKTNHRKLWSNLSGENIVRPATYLISEADFTSVILMIEPDATSAHPIEIPLHPETLTQIENFYATARPEVKLRTIRTIERGPIGEQVKRRLGFKCQICEALGLPARGFLKCDGEPYVEAHHVTPVREVIVGSLSASNIMTLCANHHRQMHFGKTSVEFLESDFVVSLEDGAPFRIPRPPSFF